MLKLFTRKKLSSQQSSDKKTCWIIGASHGIGEALAQEIFSQNYNLIISARSQDKLFEIERNLLKKNLHKKSDEITVTKTDVVDYNSLEKTCDKILQDFGKIDLVIFCSALYQPTSVINFDLAIAKQTIQVNLIGCLNLFDIIIPKMVEQKSGQIAVIASVAGYRGLPKSFAYGASKAALINLCEGIYPELKSHNIDLSVINPGFVKTRLTDKNSFKMPFIISSELAAKKILKGLEAKKFEIHFPKKFTFLLKILRLLPYSIFFFLTKKIV
ncbi:MAG: SDR family NAD(P)-dependent oxidoreductase [Rickettsiales bacterium]|nr:SDR family NAD(P)-dependent oxidoreductase [Rickettsiales bacterium]